MASVNIVDNKTASKILCSWGIHSHNKKVEFSSPDLDLVFTVKICPKCRCPKRKTLQMLFSDGRMVLDKTVYNTAVELLEEASKKLKSSNYSLSQKIHNFLKDVK